LNIALNVLLSIGNYKFLVCF